MTVAPLSLLALVAQAVTSKLCKSNFTQQSLTSRLADNRHLLFCEPSLPHCSLQIGEPVSQLIDGLKILDEVRGHPRDYDQIVLETHSFH
jgi:hypothetical protein